MRPFVDTNKEIGICKEKIKGDSAEIPINETNKLNKRFITVLYLMQ